MLQEKVLLSLNLLKGRLVATVSPYCSQAIFFIQRCHFQREYSQPFQGRLFAGTQLQFSNHVTEHQMRQGNLFQNIPAEMPEEIVSVLAEGFGRFRLERIVSRGHASPDAFWYDQEDVEWVTLLSGGAVLKFENREDIALKTGDWIEIPARARHRVESTSGKEDTVWLALHSNEFVPTGLDGSLNPM